jgi:hypothetical protein
VCVAGTPPNADDAVGCTEDSCNEATDTVDHVPNDILCDNGAFCDGAETCDVLLDCQGGTAPCSGDLVCDEDADICVECETNTDCDDAVACTADLCDAGICSNTSNCTPDETCNLTSGICEMGVMGDLVGAWGFEEPSGPTALDSSGHGNDGTLGGGAARDLSGYFGQALVTDGSSGHVDLGGLDVDAPELTVMAWINADDFGVYDARILSKSTGSATDEHIFMLSTIGGSHLRFRLRTNGSTSTLIGNGGTLGAGTWIHAAATYDGTTMRLYQDGVEVGSAPKSGPVAVDPGVALWMAANPGEPGQVFDGRIDEVKIFERALDAAEIQTEMATPVVTP